MSRERLWVILVLFLPGGNAPVLSLKLGAEFGNEQRVSMGYCRTLNCGYGFVVGPPKR